MGKGRRSRGSHAERSARRSAHAVVQIFAPGQRPSDWPAGLPDPREGPLPLVAKGQARLVVVGPNYPRRWVADLDRMPSGVLVVRKAPGDFLWQPVAAWQAEPRFDDDVDRDVVFAAIVTGRDDGRHPQHRKGVITSGLNVSYGLRMPIGNGGTGLGPYWAEPSARGTTRLAEHGDLMAGAACLVSRVLAEVFPLPATQYFTKVGLLAAKLRDEGADETKGDDPTAMGPLHHLNTTLRTRPGRETFGCVPHTDWDAKPTDAIPMSGEGGLLAGSTVSMGLWVAKGRFARPSHFGFPDYGVYLPLTQRGSLAIAWKTDESHHTEAGEVEEPADRSNDIAALSVEVGDRVQAHLVKRQREIVSNARRILSERGGAEHAQRGGAAKRTKRTKRGGKARGK